MIPPAKCPRISTDDFGIALFLGVQGKDTEEMLAFAEHAEKLQPEAIISRPPDSGKTEEDLSQYWRALAAVAKGPVIPQTTGGVSYKGPLPSPELMIQLAEEFPHFGYIEEEAGDVFARMRNASVSGDLPNVAVSHLVDPDSRLFAPRSAAVEQRIGRKPKCMQDVCDENRKTSTDPF